jgi:hypothetical protein
MFRPKEPPLRVAAPCDLFVLSRSAHWALSDFDRELGGRLCRPLNDNKKAEYGKPKAVNAGYKQRVRHVHPDFLLPVPEQWIRLKKTPPG